MKKLNQTYIDSLINRVINETLEERADNLVSKIKEKIPTDDDIYEIMSSEVTENMETCEQCGGEMREGEQCEQCNSRDMNESDMGDIEDAPTEFDYVEEEVDFEDDEESFEDNKESDKINDNTCKYHQDNFGPDDERTIRFCGTNKLGLGNSKFSMNERLHGGQKKLDKNKNGKIDSEDFKMLRKKTQGYDDREDEREGIKHGKLKSKDLSSMKSRRGDAKFERRGETEEGNAFTKKLKQTPKGGKFKMGNKEYTDNSNLDENKKISLKLTESEMISLIERIIIQEQKSNIKQSTSKGYEKYKQVHNKDGKENTDALKATAKKMKEYLKDGSKGGYDTNPDTFPKGNGELAKMSKKAYVPSGSVQDYVDNFTAAALENLDYDGINPNEDWVTDNIEGSSRTGNNPEWANTGKSDVNKKRNKIRKDNMLGKLKRKAYNKAPQPAVIDKSGEDEGDKIMAKLESIEPKKKEKISEEFDRMKQLIQYTKKTQ
jgi:hypothetical protein